MNNNKFNKKEFYKLLLIIWILIGSFVGLHWSFFRKIFRNLFFYLF
jgi:hypothetical protein